jgi:5-(carboxyamino)imidazole ribonucleotide synthase
VPDPANPLVAVLGGGQLGRMLGLAGIPMGLRFRFLDPTEAAPAAAVGELVVGGLGDDAALRAVTEGADAVTYEWEGVPAEGARLLEREGHAVRPSPRSLDVSQDRLAEKQLFEELGIGVPRFAPVEDRASLHRAVEEIGTPSVLKTRRGGYDGKGQVVIRERDQVDGAFDEVAEGGPLILEAFVPFVRELSVVAVRALDGEVRCWSVVENHHELGILRTTRAPAPQLDGVVEAQAERAVKLVLEELGHVGVLTLELFEIEGGILANEIAPRVHNSGHWTIEGAVTSQFENHLRAVLGWPLGSCDARGVSVMVNCIGVLPDPESVLHVPGAHLHRYGKEPRPARKVGHVTLTAPDEAELRSRLDALRSVMPDDVG